MCVCVCVCVCVLCVSSYAGIIYTIHLLLNLSVGINLTHEAKKKVIIGRFACTVSQPVQNYEHVCRQMPSVCW